jgi:hypothetical protein
MRYPQIDTLNRAPRTAVSFLWRLSDDAPGASDIVGAGRHPKPFTKPAPFFHACMSASTGAAITPAPTMLRAPGENPLAVMIAPTEAAPPPLLGSRGGQRWFYSCQKSGLSAVGTAASFSVPYLCGFSAQTPERLIDGLQRRGSELVALFSSGSRLRRRPASHRASEEGRPAFQEADHLLDSALARSMAAAVQRSDRQVDHASACWEDRVRGERLDRGAASLDFPGSRTWAPFLSSNLRCRRPHCLLAAGAETGRFSRTDPLRTSSPQIQRFLFIALAVLFAASFTAAFASPAAFWASPFSS